MGTAQGTAMGLLGTANACPDLQYASGFRAVDAVVWVAQGRRRALVVPEMERGRAMACLRGGCVWTPEDLKLTGAALREPALWMWAALLRLGARTVRVPASFPLGAARVLERRGVRVSVSRAPLFPQRAVKRDDEIRWILMAQRAAVAAMKAAMRCLSEAAVGRGGVLRWAGKVLTAERVREIIDETLLAHDCAAEETIVAGGEQAVDPHERGHGPLRAGQAVVLDIFPRHRPSGYWGDLTRTVVKGPCSVDLRRMFVAVRRAQGRALAAVRAGVKAAAVHRAAEQSLTESGYATCVEGGRRVGFIHGTGHGVGLAVHEAPSLSRTSPDVLRAGNVVTVEPGLYYPGLGGVRLEDTVVVTTTGWRLLARCPAPFRLRDPQ